MIDACTQLPMCIVIMRVSGCACRTGWLSGRQAGGKQAPTTAGLAAQGSGMVWDGLGGSWGCAPTTAQCMCTAAASCKQQAAAGWRLSSVLNDRSKFWVLHAQSKGHKRSPAPKADMYTAPAGESRLVDWRTAHNEHAGGKQARISQAHEAKHANH